MVQYVVFALSCYCSWCVWWRSFKVNFRNLEDFSILLKSYFTFRAEELLQTMRNAYGSHGCYLLVINSKPKKGSMIEPGLPAPDPWLRFLPRKASKVINFPYFFFKLKYRYIKILLKRSIWKKVTLSWYNWMVLIKVNIF